MARRIRRTLGTPFLRLPRNLARDIALYLEPFRVENVPDLNALVGVYPLDYLSIALQFSLLNAANLGYVARILNDERHAMLTLDVSIYSIQGRLDTELVKVLLQCVRVEGLTLYNVSMYFKENMDVLKDFAASMNSGHVVHFADDHDADDGDEYGNSGASMVEGARHIAGLLRKDASLLSINFRWSSVKIDPKLLRQSGFWDGLRCNRSLCYLTLYDVGLDCRDAVLLCEALDAHSCVEYLNIAANEIGDEGVIAIAQWLKMNTKLLYLLQGSVHATSSGCVALADALCENTTLELLIMKDDPLGPVAGRAFAAMLKVNSTLRYLGLDYCELEAEGGRFFISALAVNRTLETLRLNYNGIGAQDSAELARVAMQAGVLTRLEVADINLLVNDGTKTGGRMSFVSAQDVLGGSYLWHLRGLSALNKQYASCRRSGAQNQLFL